MANDVIGNEGDRVLGRDAQRNNILAARVVSETVRTTLGPKGMDKMLVDRAGNVVVTNDGVTILEEMEIEHPAAKMIVEIAKTQEREVGDGTTTAVMLAGKFLENAEKLLDMKIHPTIICRGYRWAEERSQEILKELAVELSSREELVKIAATAMTGKGAESNREHLANLVVMGIDQVASGKEINMSGHIKLKKVLIPLRSLVENEDYWIGVIRRLKGDYNAALSYLNRAIKKKPKDGNAYFERAVIYFEMEDPDKCEENLAKAKKLGMKRIFVKPNGRLKKYSKKTK